MHRMLEAASRRTALEIPPGVWPDRPTCPHGDFREYINGNSDGTPQKRDSVLGAIVCSGPREGKRYEFLLATEISAEILDCPDDYGIATHNLPKVFVQCRLCIL